MKLRSFVPVLIIAVGFWAYHNSFHGPFIFDDGPSITDNPHIRHLWPLFDAMSAPPGSPVDGRPVVCLTLALNYAWGGLNVRGYHAFNLMVHVASALVLFGIVRRTLQARKSHGRFGNAAGWLAAAIALIWEVHPLQTESVTYVVQRTELLMGLFLLLTLYCALRGATSTRPLVWCVGAVASCALGMGSKEVMVCAPLIVLLYDRVFLAASFRELWQRRGGLYLGLAATWLILAGLVARKTREATGLGVHGITSWNYLKTEAGVIVYYLQLSLWPKNLVIDYYDWPITSSLRSALVPGAIVVGLLGATVCAFRRRPELGFLGAWFFLVLAPTSSFLPSFGEVAAERRMYLPLAAVITAVVLGAFALGKRFFTNRRGAVLGCLAGGCLVATLMSLTIQRNRDYRSALAIWQDALQKRPHNARAHDNLGVTLVHLGRVAEAVEHYQAELQIEPGYLGGHYNLGIALATLGRPEEAVEQYQQALLIRPGYADAHNNLGIALIQVGRLPEAIEHFEEALRLNPHLADAHYNLGIALAQTGRLPEAMGHWEQALRIEPDNADIHFNLAHALELMHHTADAADQYRLALKFRPDFTAASNALARLDALNRVETPPAYKSSSP
ncbi:MAG TPA: tetratricopeptide repeat protein [Verrucomicrobiae bacterium]|nr:tetratricopeptide repeat protein [Verrucomicrobiae bacterium]